MNIDQPVGPAVADVPPDDREQDRADEHHDVAPVAPVGRQPPRAATRLLLDRPRSGRRCVGRCCSAARAFSSGWSSGMRSRRSKSCLILTANIRALQYSRQRRRPARHRRSGPHARISAIPGMSMSPLSLHQCRGQRATKFVGPLHELLRRWRRRLRARRPPCSERARWPPCSTALACRPYGVVIAMHPQCRTAGRAHVASRARVVVDAIERMFMCQRPIRARRGGACRVADHQEGAEGPARAGPAGFWRNSHVNALQASSAGSLAMTG